MGEKIQLLQPRTLWTCLYELISSAGPAPVRLWRTAPTNNVYNSDPLFDAYELELNLLEIGPSAWVVHWLIKMNFEIVIGFYYVMRIGLRTGRSLMKRVK